MYPRHIVLAAVVAGLLVGPRAATAAVAALGVVLGAAVAFAGASRMLTVLVASALFLTAGWAARRVDALEHTRLGPDVGHVVTGRATILQAPRPSPFGGWAAPARFRGEPVLLRISAPGGPPGDAARAPRATAAPVPEIGEIVRVRAAVRAPDDYARHLHAHAILRAFDLTPTGRRRGGIAGRLDAVRRRAERALAHGRDPTRAALLQGMVLGQDAGLPADARDDVRAAGLSHLTAASGANVVLLATIVLAAAALIGVPFHARWLIVLAVIAAYVPLAGGGPSILRAGVMGAAGVAAVLAGRPAARWYALGLAALVTLGLDPRAAADSGWQLSFAAVVALLVLARPWAERAAAHGAPRPVAEALAVTAAATLATAPLIALRFGQVAPLSLPANLLVAPAVAPIMWVGAMVVAAGGSVPGLDGLAGLVLDPLTGGILAVAHAAARGPAPSVPPPAVALVALAALGAIGRERVIWVRLPGARRRVPLALPAAGLAVAALVGARVLRGAGAPVAPPVAGFRVSFLDVGQGDATLLQVPGHAMLVDTGPPGSPTLGILRRAGVRALDALVVTHAQADHDGNAAAILAALPVGVLVDGRDGVRSPVGDAFAAAARRRGVRVVAGRAGMVVRAGGLTLRVLSPGDGPTTAQTGADPNERAIVAEADAGGGRVLLTADAESDVLDRLDLGAVDILKVSHHGSADPGLPGLLERLQPVVAGIEVGAGNTYGHPAPATLAALRAVVPQTVRTDVDGTVRADLMDGRWTIARQHAGAAR
ncbi:ComEC/Rec2 family competence protein [Paraconexibacter antarcticus]|uniref:ComEC/Rec2 family competence protein n=1 Tax=Paraconexibacter antarcticus TaxID=2949664 RepID=A0ABY5DKX2_9ACTN|nr:ComEC/Rec2 family competence protein [Paraconexibacter antarcticus]UTI62408.1 ComEC/Rec2 family competence protein [Paraconexibacter antarcticus]